MTPLESVFAAWIAFHAELGVDMEKFLFPPATDAQIVELEEAIGYSLPDDLRELYKIANGQWSMFEDSDTPLSEFDSDERWAPLFGNYEFLPLHRALAQYEIYLDLYTSETEFRAKYNKANPNKKYEPVIWEVREGDVVDPAGWNPNWFTFAGADANSYSVDLFPPRGGSPGQVVLHGADEFVLQVIGISVTDMMQQALDNISTGDEYRYQYEESDYKYLSSVYFNMDWRAELYIPHEQPEMPAAYTAWLEEQEQSRERQREKLDQWLRGRNLSDDTRESLIQWLSADLMSNAAATPPLSVMMEMQMQRIAQGEMPDIPELLQGFAAPSDAQARANEMRNYAAALAGTYLRSDSTMYGHELTMPVEDAIALFHQYKFESGDWTSDELKKMDALGVELQNVPLDIEGGYSIFVEDASMSICTIKFDEETFKSDEICHYVDLSNL